MTLGPASPPSHNDEVAHKGNGVLDMTTKTDTKAIWTPVDTESMGEKLGKMLNTYKAAQKVANEARDAFNTAFIAAATKAGKIPDGHTLLISHKFGQTSVSLVKADQKASKGSSKPKFSF